MSDEDNDYGDEDFEDFETSGTFSGKSLKPGTSTKEASPNPKPNPHHVRLQQIQQQESPSAAVKKPATPRAATTNSEDYNLDEDNDDDGDDDGGEEEQSKPDLLTQMGGVVDLESYLKNMLASPPAANEDEEDDSEENKELQPLEGVQPEDEDQRRLQAKLGYSPEKKAPSLNQAASPSPTLSQSSVANFQPHNVGVPPIVSHGSSSSTQLKSGDHGDDHVAQLLAMAGASVNRSSAAKNSSDVENALKVDALLRDLFPDRYKDKETPVAAAIPPKKAKGKTKSKKASVGGAQQYGLGAPRPARKPDDYAGEDEDEENYRTDEGEELDHRRKSGGGGGGGGGDLLGGLEQQLKMLKKELKTKDDKIQRLTEHSMMMANQMDKLRGEVARLNARLHEAQMELEAKEARLVEAMRKKKKDKKKQSEEKDLSGASASVYEGEILRLREREQALMDAVEELSSQNEDLIVKLRESMARELELSSKRAQLVSHTVHRGDGVAGGGGSMLPSIHEKHGGGGGMLRAQTEPALNNGYGSNNNHHEEYGAKAAGKKKKKHSSG